MYDRFTDRARKVMQLANQEAQRFNHDYIGAEHILLGLLKVDSGAAVNVLTSLGVDLRKVRLDLENLLARGPEMVTMGKLPQTPEAKKVIEYALLEARNLNHNYVCTEHILLGLLREPAGGAGTILVAFGLTYQRVRKMVRTRALGAGTPARSPAVLPAGGNPHAKLATYLARQIMAAGDLPGTGFGEDCLAKKLMKLLAAFAAATAVTPSSPSIARIPLVLAADGKWHAVGWGTRGEPQTGPDLRDSLHLARDGCGAPEIYREYVVTVDLPEPPKAGQAEELEGRIDPCES